MAKLTSISRDVFGHIAEFLGGEQIFRLHCTGDSVLIQKLRTDVGSISSPFYAIFKTYTGIRKAKFYDQDTPVVGCRFIIMFWELGIGMWVYFANSLSHRKITNCDMNAVNTMIEKAMLDYTSVDIRIISREKYDLGEFKFHKCISSYIGCAEMVYQFPHLLESSLGGKVTDTLPSSITYLRCKVDNDGVYFPPTLTKLFLEDIADNRQIDLSSLSHLRKLTLAANSYKRAVVKFPPRPLSMKVLSTIELEFINCNLSGFVYMGEYLPHINRIIRIFPPTITKLKGRFDIDMVDMQKFTNLKHFQSCSFYFTECGVRYNFPPSITKIDISNVFLAGLLSDTEYKMQLAHLTNLRTLTCSALVIKEFPPYLTDLDVNNATPVFLLTLPPTIIKLRVGFDKSYELQSIINALPTSITCLSTYKKDGTNLTFPPNIQVAKIGEHTYKRDMDGVMKCEIISD